MPLDLPFQGLTNADQVASVQNSHPVSKPKLCRPKAPMRLRPTTVPLPAVSIAGIQRKNQNALTIEDLPQIRSKVTDFVDTSRECLKIQCLFEGADG